MLASTKSSGSRRLFGGRVHDSTSKQKPQRGQKPLRLHYCVLVGRNNTGQTCRIITLVCYSSLSRLGSHNHVVHRWAHPHHRVHLGLRRRLVARWASVATPSHGASHEGIRGRAGSRLTPHSTASKTKDNNNSNTMSSLSSRSGSRFSPVFDTAPIHQARPSYSGIKGTNCLMPTELAIQGLDQ